MSQPGQRQTKKRKKALAFRTRQKTSKKNKGLSDNEDALDFPIDENQDVAGLADLPPEDEEVPAGGGPDGRKGKAKGGGQRQPQLGGSKKRKREGEEVVEEKPRKRSKAQPAILESGVEGGDGQETVEVGRKVQPQRFILFIGNLKYSTTKEAILSHFSSCDPPPTARLPTPKTTQPSKSKGYAFLEFTDKKALQQALRLHHSELEGRKINIELTAGGGGKSDHRTKKLQERNKGLHEQRKRRIEKRKPVAKDAEIGHSELKALERPQRYSTTSGFGQAPSNKKTWSIPATEDHEASKHSKKRKRPAKPKDQGTGVNAIPVY